MPLWYEERIRVHPALPMALQAAMRIQAFARIDPSMATPTNELELEE